MIIQRHQPPATVSLADVSSDGAGTEVDRVDCWCRTSRHFYFIKDVVTSLMVHKPRNTGVSTDANYLSFITWDRFFSVLSGDLHNCRAPSDTDMWCQCGNPADLTLPTLWLFQFRGPQSPNHHRQEDRWAWKQPWRYSMSSLGKYLAWCEGTDWSLQDVPAWSEQCRTWWHPGHV